MNIFTKIKYRPVLSQMGSTQIPLLCIIPKYYFLFFCIILFCSNVFSVLMLGDDSPNFKTLFHTAPLISQGMNIISFSLFTRKIAQCHLFKAVLHEAALVVTAVSRISKYKTCLSNVGLSLCSNPETLIFACCSHLAGLKSLSLYRRLLF